MTRENIFGDWEKCFDVFKILHIFFLISPMSVSTELVFFSSSMVHGKVVGSQSHKSHSSVHQDEFVTRFPSAPGAAAAQDQ